MARRMNGGAWVGPGSNVQDLRRSRATFPAPSGPTLPNVAYDFGTVDLARLGIVAVAAVALGWVVLKG